MNHGTAPFNDKPFTDTELALLHSQRAAALASLTLTKRTPDLRAGAMQYIKALEEAIDMPRTFPSTDVRRFGKDAPLCKCGCGGRVGRNSETDGWHEYLIHHQPK